MQKLKKLFVDSALELKKPQTLAITAFFLALNITMDLLNLRIQLAMDLRIGFGFVCNAMIGMLYGPSVAMLAGVASDVLGYMVNTGGGAYFPGFTLTAVLAGLIWGLVLYQQRVTFLRALAAKLTINLFLNVGLNSAWLYLLYNKAFFAGIPLRLIKNMVMLPIEVFMIMTIGGIVSVAYRRLKIRSV